MSNSQNTKQFFPTLTGFRAVAAWIIFIYHFFPFKNINHPYPKWIADFVWEFHIGVDIFFVLSGFLTTYRYFDNQPIHFKKYMVNRIARIYPIYFLLTFTVFLVGFSSTGVWNWEKTIEAILSFTVTKALFSDYIFAKIPQDWTLTLEEIFYSYGSFLPHSYPEKQKMAVCFTIIHFWFWNIPQTYFYRERGGVEGWGGYKE